MEKNDKAVHLRLVFTYFSKTFPILRNILPGHFFKKKNWDSFHARLNSHYEAWSYKKKKHKKDYSIQEIYLERTYS